MNRNPLVGAARLLLGLASLLVIIVPCAAESPKRHPEPSVLVLFDGPNQESNPGRLDAHYLANLLGHFTTRRTIESLENYVPGQIHRFDAVFTIVYSKEYA